MTITVKVEGLAELERALTQLPKKVQDRPLRQAMNAGAQVIKRQAISNAEPFRDTGTLRRNIIVSRSNRQSRNGRQVYFVLVRTKRKKYADTRSNRRKGIVGRSYNVQGDAFYWRFLEFGTVKFKATRFFTRAFEERKGAALDVIKSKMKESIDRLTREYAWTKTSYGRGYLD
jgi:HK97 gp10 family phage protein